MSNGSIISKEDAKTMIQKYQNDYPNAVKAQLYDGNLIQQMLDDTGTDAIRIYHALDADDNHCLVLVCVDENGNDLADNVVVEYGTCCPPTCDVNSYFM